VTPHQIDAPDWPAWSNALSPQIERMAAGSGGRYLPEDIHAAILNRQFQAWIALDDGEVVCLLLTQVMSYPRLSALRCIGVVGTNPHRWTGLLSWLENEAVERFGCSRMEALHPVRQERLLTTGGWTTFHILSEKMLCEG
jgi:hypothetical protein